jgi:major vault protein
MSRSDEFEQVLFRIPPYEYVHVLDSNTNVTRNITGPTTFTRQDHEKVVHGPASMITIPPRHYVLIANPAVRHAETNEPVMDEHGLIQLKHGDFEVRLSSAPFPLYPGEAQHGIVSQLRVVEKNQALKLKATREFIDLGGVQRLAGDMWLFQGPGTYTPQVEVEEVELMSAFVIGHSQALRLKAITETIDCKGVARCAGEEWLVRDTGAYMPSIDEEVVDTVVGIVLTEKRAVHMCAYKTFTDVYNVQRKAGEQWLVTSVMTDSHICDVYEQVMGDVSLLTLTSRQYAVILDPFVDSVQKLGAVQLRKGESSFFLQPGEKLRAGIQSVEVLADSEALLLQATEALEDSEPCNDSDDGHMTDTVVQRQPGDRWMVYGPRDYIPPVEVEVVERRHKIPLDKNEGIYVRNIDTGVVTAIVGETYMLNPHEELWEKELPAEVEDLLSKQAQGNTYVPSDRRSADHDYEHILRDKTKVVTFRVAHNAACQVYDFKTKTSRVLFGPDLVMLSPDEQFTVLSLSGDKPKQPGMIKSLQLMLGPDFMTDIIVVETSDHARLRLQLAYNWHFMIPEDADKSAIFNVRDFVGDACKVCCRQIINFELIQSVDRQSHLEFDLPLPVSHLTTSIRIQPRSFANLYLELAKTAKFETFSNLLQTIWL